MAGCAGELSTLAPAGPVAASIARLWWVMAAGAVIPFVLVVALFGLTMLRPGFGGSITPRTWILLGGVVLPLSVVLPLLAYAFHQGERLLLVGTAAEAPPVRIEARARMWQWEFFYPGLRNRPSTVGTMHVPAGATVEVVATSEDVIHSFWVPRLAGKVDAIPGHATRLRLVADVPGTYWGACTEYCGVGHTGMLFAVQAHSPETFARAVEAAAASAGAAMGGSR